MKPIVGLLSIALAFVAGCSKPKPPSLIPRSAQVSAIKPDGVQLALVLAAHNPNRFPIVVSRVTGTLELHNGKPLGSAQNVEPFTIPAEGDRDIEARLDVPFDAMQAFAPYALAAKPLPYRIRGSAHLGGESLNVEVPFSIEGQLTREQLVLAGLNGAARLLAPAAP